MSKAVSDYEAWGTCATYVQGAVVGAAGETTLVQRGSLGATASSLVAQLFGGFNYTPAGGAATAVA